jgi:hypothetical protein
MKFISYLTAVIVIGAILFGAHHVINAQQAFDPIGSGMINQQVSSTVVPENPAPGQSVTISLNAYGTNLNAANISWSVNGTQVQRGTGLTQYVFNAGKFGETKNIVAGITPTSGPTITQTFTIIPQDVAIIYESDGYVPPFYKGKGTYGREGAVNLVAVPNLMSGGVKLNPATLTYKWIVDGTVQGSKSGYGKNSFAYVGSILGNSVTIEVEVTSGNNKVVKGKAAILLGPLAGELLAYEKNPLYGIMFNKEISSNGFSLSGKEVTVAAIPFSTSATGKETGLSYTWTINGSTIPVPKTDSTATFRNSTGQQGASLIGVSVSNTTHLLQSMKKTLSINF